METLLSLGLTRLPELSRLRNRGPRGQTGGEWAIFLQAFQDHSWLPNIPAGLVFWKETLKWGLPCRVFIGISYQEGRGRKQGGRIGKASANPAESLWACESGPCQPHLPQSLDVGHMRACLKVGQLPAAKADPAGMVGWRLGY